MPQTNRWSPVEPDWETVLTKFSNPIRALAEMETPAVVIRDAYPPEHCQGLIQRFTQMGLIFDQNARHDDASVVPPERIDIGTSLGNRGNSPEAFFAHAQETHKLFETLFDGFINPVTVLYDALKKLAPGKRVVTAYERDGRLYGPAIFRVHYGGYAYVPHFDSVRWREHRVNYEVYRFEHQFAGLICFQNSEIAGETAQAIIHRCLWQPEIDPHIKQKTFHQYAADQRIEKARVDLVPGDLYFFNTRCIHEVPGVKGKAPRIVLAIFIGYSPDDDEVFVWS